MITSLQNPRIKHLVRLRDRRPRDEAGVFLIEGYRQILRALEKNIPLTELYFSPPWFLGENEPALLSRAAAAGAQLIELTKDAFAKVAYRDRPDGLLALAPQWHNTLATLDTIMGNARVPRADEGRPDPRPTENCVTGEGVRPTIATFSASPCAQRADPPTQAPLTSPSAPQPFSPSAPFLLVVESIEKPGNLGTILRSADAAGVHAVIVCDPVTDIFNPNVVRSSTGTLFSVPVIISESPAVRAWLRDRNIRAIATTPSATTPHYDADLRGPLAIIMGSEQYGLSDYWLRESDAQVRIPMHGQADSLNVAMATIITLFEALRQRYSPNSTHTSTISDLDPIRAGTPHNPSPEVT